METKHIPIKQDLDIFAARRAAREMAQALGFDLVDTTAIETAVSELATNALRHAGGGAMTLKPLDALRKPGLEVDCQDRGPGITDVEAALRGTAHTGTGLGIGLGGVKRLMNELKIESRLEMGTRIVARKWMSGRQGSREPVLSGVKEAGETGEQGSRGVFSSAPSLLCTSAQFQLAPWTIQVAAASRPATGMTANGDAWLARDDDDRLLIALVDGLGHGVEAAQVAQQTIAFVEQHYRQSLSDIMQGCHVDLQGTRGVVLGLARFDPRAGTLTYAGIGNTGIRVVSRAPARPISLSGIVGYTMRRVREESFPCAPGDVIVMYTDGISERFDLEALLRRTSDLRDLVETILRDYGRENDDATAVAIRVKREA